MKKTKKLFEVAGLFLMGCYFALMVEYGIDVTLAIGGGLGLLLVVISYKLEDIITHIQNYIENK